ncbi:Gfo/Idh/MocA family protein [Roseobacter ponti]|uniref:Gfo/Idh/MocA family oxidoreductase n=1 Tax=Roseobacter ponti TaxID=1891787 RepID=A0A858SQQ1_9RHOB|nr:Gfo/Idh/MocA family oxidoreductase [Roseobacter ponti]QJF50700.1 Gfo/Idh/MocA family oxidoreductase [Roseobacter ponti]
MTHLRWGILGASNFAAEQMAPAIHAAKGADLVALGTSDPQKAARFTAFAPGLTLHDTYDAVLADPDVDAIYIPLPNHLHVEWSLKALEAGKHVLCEKPMTMRADEFDQLIAARDKSGKLAAEAFMIVHHPQFLRAKELVSSGSIGTLRHVDAVFSYCNTDTGNIRNQAQAGGGGLPDIGVYTFGSTRFVTGQEPDAVPFARIDFENDVDVFVQMAAGFPDFSYAAVISMRMFNRQEVVFHGDRGVLRMTCPFNAAVYDQAELSLETAGQTRRVERFPGVNHYVLQVEAFTEAARTGGKYACPLEFSKGTQRMIDMTFAAAKKGA